MQAWRSFQIEKNAKNSDLKIKGNKDAFPQLYS